MYHDKIVMIIENDEEQCVRLCRLLLARYPEVNKVIIYNRNKHSQHLVSLKQQYGTKLKRYIGDVLQMSRLKKAMSRVDYVIYNGDFQNSDAEFSGGLLRAFVKGTENLIQAAAINGVQRVLSISTDEACIPISLKGAARLCSEMLITKANKSNSTEGKNSRLSVCRMSRGIDSEDGWLEYLRQSRNSGSVTIFNSQATRFYFTNELKAHWCLKGLALMKGGEIIVPQAPSVGCFQLAKLICRDCQVKEANGGFEQRLHEQLISADEGARVLELPECYLIQYDCSALNESEINFESNVKKAAEGFFYSSGNNGYALESIELRLLLRL